MVVIEFHPVAIEDMKDLYDYFAKSSIQYADSFIEGLLNLIEDLKSFPEMGKIYEENKDYRQLIYRNYRILYKFIQNEDKVVIMIIVHCSRQLRL